jgi:hypothetical protein
VYVFVCFRVLGGGERGGVAGFGGGGGFAAGFFGVEGELDVGDWVGGVGCYEGERAENGSDEKNEGIREGEGSVGSSREGGKCKKKGEESTYAQGLPHSKDRRSVAPPSPPSKRKSTCSSSES